MNNWAFCDLLELGFEETNSFCLVCYMMGTQFDVLFVLFVLCVLVMFSEMK